MKFVCDRCQTKYSIADERVRGKVLKVKCKTCGNLITVREGAGRRVSSAGLPTLSASAASGAAAAPAQVRAPAVREESERTVLAPHPPDPALLSRRPTGPIPAVGGGLGDDRVQWYMALDGQRSGPFSRKLLVDRLVGLPRDADLHIWNDHLDGWKVPTDVPAIAHDLTARRKPSPPPPPGAPRRPTPVPPPPPLEARATRRPTPPPASPLGSGIGLKLPPPSGGTSKPAAPPLAAASASAADLFSAHPTAARADGDPASLLETPAPLPHMYPGVPGTNGVGNGAGSGAHRPLESGASIRPALRATSDALNMLNLPGAPQPAAGAAPRLMSGAATVGWDPGVATSASRTRNARLVFVLLGVVGTICIVITLAAVKKRTPPPVAVSKPAVDPIAALAERAAEMKPPPEPPKVEEPPIAPVVQSQPPPTSKGKRGSRSGRAMPAAAAPAPAPAPAPVGADAARYRDTSRPSITVAAAASSNRPPPSQNDISRVINNNRAGIKNCYQRALLRDSSLTHGKITVKVTIGISGRVKYVGINGPAQFRALEPCIRDIVSRWAFPQASDEYGTEFAYVFQGNE